MIIFHSSALHTSYDEILGSIYPDFKPMPRPLRLLEPDDPTGSETLNVWPLEFQSIIPIEVRLPLLKYRGQDPSGRVAPFVEEEFTNLDDIPCRVRLLDG